MPFTAMDVGLCLSFRHRLHIKEQSTTTSVSGANFKGCRSIRPENSMYPEGNYVISTTSSVRALQLEEPHSQGTQEPVSGTHNAIDCAM